MLGANMNFFTWISLTSRWTSIGTPFRMWTPTAGRVVRRTIGGQEMYRLGAGVDAVGVIARRRTDARRFYSKVESISAEDVIVRATSAAS